MASILSFVLEEAEVVGGAVVDVGAHPSRVVVMVVHQGLPVISQTALVAEVVVHCFC